MEAKSDKSENSYKDSLFAQLYDFVVERLGRQNLDSDLVRLCCERFGDPVLEMGCGTGLELLPLAKMGFSVTGLDNSPQMLSVFEQKLSNAEPEVRNNVQLIVGDIIDPPINRSDFRLILFIGSQFLHLKTDEQRLGCLQNSRRLLADEGVVLICNSKLTEKLEYNWIEQPGKLDDKWILQAQGKIVHDAYQEDLKLIPKSQGEQEHLFRWRLYPVEDAHMKELIKKSGLQYVPLPPDMPIRPTSFFYLCKK
ncbi:MULTISPECIES: class I SAM-dependent methyltransferase [Cyanophyceae]|uniref:class I SAM-dependent methyltransferase n=1 Tax=Cyanophyceae TaxID=3028117 RepID=UPI001686BAED|nr:class I SAM-dependent methyltransferase [Trichocoleus sp. FACHB-40]MBD2006991.1 methyltransferase domain-containing protein [Trichocoleus sp. FACHB-40]